MDDMITEKWQRTLKNLWHRLIGAHTEIDNLAQEARAEGEVVLYGDMTAASAMISAAILPVEYQIEKIDDDEDDDDDDEEDSEALVITYEDFKDPCFPSTDEIIAACLKYVGDADWPDDDWIPLSTFEINLWLDEDEQRAITYYPVENGDVNTSIGVRIVIPKGDGA